ncbi:AAA family ATPase [Halobellus ruber]|uniref:AAA family ATPase n=1 Tax=Halobellus ruber TaxID=2761102 RepID=A0A7J9SM63_9EURY|nr:AAA family ATPase [Halobellus ruber]MBB6646111.1 AAA family ATPase [Halobellus ruber]
MTQSVTLTAAIDDTIEGCAVPSAIADRLGVAEDDVVALRYGIDREVVASVRPADDLAGGTVRLAPSVADRLDVDGGERIAVAAVDLADADSVTVAPIPRLSVRGGEALLREAMGDTPVTEGETVSVSLFDGSLDVPFRVLSTEPPGPVVVGSETEIGIDPGPAPVGTAAHATPIPDSAVGGYDEVAAELVSALDTLFQASDDATDATARRVGLLLSGPHGVGKTHLLRYAAWATDATINRVNPQRLLSAGASAADEYLHSVATTAQASGRGIVHVDAFDTVVEEAGADTVAAIRSWLDRLRTVVDTAVVAEVTDPSEIPSDLRQGARLSKCIEVSEPGRADRRAVLSTLAAGTPTRSSIEIESVSRRAFGYVAADLVSLWLTTVESAIERSDGDRVAVSEADLERGLAETEPSGLDGTTVDVPTTTFDDIGGLEEPKRELTRAIEWPLVAPELFEDLNIEPPAGVLLYGPPGTGKTLLARAVASSSEANFVAVNGPELMNRYVGESERAVRRVFERARSNSPSVLFFDEVDAIGATRTQDSDSPATERVVSQLLTELDGVEGREGITVLGATNRPRRLDDALLRPGRFDRVVSVPLPDHAARAEIFRIHLADKNTAPFDSDGLAERTDGYTGSDIAAVVREAGLAAIESRLADASDPPATGDGHPAIRIEAEHLRHGLDAVSPSLSAEARSRYESFDRFE